MADDRSLAWGHHWRSSSWFIVSCIAIALFSENFLYTYIVPILSVMLEERLHIDESRTQAATSTVLSLHAFVSMLSGPLIGHFSDKLSSRKSSLLLSLAAEMLGTIMIMVATNMPVLLLGRSIQAIGGNAACIVGLATLSDNLGPKNTGRSLGALTTFYGSGLLFGPLVSGALLQWAGYWVTWMAALVLLGIDMIMRLLMIENGQGGQGESKHEHRSDIESNEDMADAQSPQVCPKVDDGETAALLGDSESRNSNHTFPKLPESASAHLSRTGVSAGRPAPDNFYKFIFTNPRALTALACHAQQAIILLSLDTTLPLHARRTFGWNTAQVSAMFLAVQLPSLLFVALTGMLKDKVGTRIPTGCGFLAMAVWLWLLGASTSSDLLFFIPAGARRQAATFMSLIGIGCARTFISGVAILEITNIMKEGKSQCFGPNGKMSSAYSVTNFTWNAGLLIGPLLAGSLVRTVGYYYMNVVVAILSFVVGIVALRFLGKQK